MIENFSLEYVDILPKTPVNSMKMGDEQSENTSLDVFAVITYRWLPAKKRVSLHFLGQNKNSPQSKSQNLEPLSTLIALHLY